MRVLYACLLSVIWFTLPTSASANTWAHVGERWSDRDTVDHGWFEQDTLIHRVTDPSFADHFGLNLGRDRDKRESERDRGSDSAISGKGMRSYDTPLGPSFDIPDSVDGHSDRPDPWWGRRTEGEPMLKDMRDVNRDPMRSP